MLYFRKKDQQNNIYIRFGVRLLQRANPVFVLLIEIRVSFSSRSFVYICSRASVYITANLW